MLASPLWLPQIIQLIYPSIHLLSICRLFAHTKCLSLSRSLFKQTLSLTSRRICWKCLIIFSTYCFPLSLTYFSVIRHSLSPNNPTHWTIGCTIVACVCVYASALLEFLNLPRIHHSVITWSVGLAITSRNRTQGIISPQLYLMLSLILFYYRELMWKIFH